MALQLLHYKYAEKNTTNDGTYNGVLDDRQQTNYVRSVPQILQNFNFSLYFLLFHWLQAPTNKHCIKQKCETR